MTRLPRAAPLFVAPVVLVGHLVIAAFSPQPAPFLKYPAAAAARAAGELEPERLVDFSPLYLELAGWTHRLAPGQETPVLLGLHFLLTAVAAGAFAAWLGRRVSTKLAMAGIALFAFDRQVVVHERLLEPEILLLCLATLWLALQDRRPGAAGVAAALALATRPSFLPVLLLAPAADLLRTRPAGTSWTRRRIARRTLLLLGPSALVFVLLGLRAEHATGSFFAPSMNPGTVFFEGNNPLSRGTSATYPPGVLELSMTSSDVPDIAHTFYRKVARIEGEATVGEVNAYWSSRARQFLVDHPVAAAELLRTKLVKALHSFAWHDVPSVWRFEGSLPFPGVPFGLVSTAALLGLLAQARRWRQDLPILGLFGAQLAVMLVFYVSARQRIVWWPAIVYFAVRGVAALLRADSRRRLVFGLPMAILALVLCLPTADTQQERAFRRGWVEAEQIIAEVRRRVATAPPLARHADLAVEAIAAAPWWLDRMRPSGFPTELGSLESRVADRLEERVAQGVSTRFDLARMSYRAGRLDRADALFAELIEEGAGIDRGPWHATSPYLFRARIALRRGQRDAARRWLEQAAEHRPGDPWVLAERWVFDADGASLEQLEALWSPLERDLLGGRAFMNQHEPRKAAEHLERVVTWFPELRSARLDRAAALGQAGELERGVTEYLVAARERPDPTRRVEELQSLFRDWATAEATPEARLTTIRVLTDLGAFSEARERLAELPDDLVEPAQRARLMNRIEASLAAVPPEGP